MRQLFFDFRVITATVFLTISSLQLTGCATTSEKHTSETHAPEIHAPKPVAKTENKAEKSIAEKNMAERWGVEIMWIKRTAAGFMLDFRYRVLDAEKAAPLFNRRTKPQLIHQASGAKFVVPNPPKTGPLRTSNTPQDKRAYWMFFGNPGRYVKVGDKVTVVIGDFRAENLIVK